MPSFVNNVDAIVSKVGTAPVGLIWSLANVNWESDQDREIFLEEVTKQRFEV